MSDLTSARRKELIDLIVEFGETLDAVDAKRYVLTTHPAAMAALQLKKQRTNLEKLRFATNRRKPA